MYCIITVVTTLLDRCSVYIPLNESSSGSVLFININERDTCFDCITQGDFYLNGVLFSTIISNWITVESRTVILRNWRDRFLNVVLDSNNNVVECRSRTRISYSTNVYIISKY